MEEPANEVNKSNNYQIFDTLETPPQESHIVSSEAEIPRDESRIFLSKGHAAYLPVEAIDPNFVYALKTGREPDTYYVYYLSIPPDKLIENKLFQDNVVINTPRMLEGPLGKKTNVRDLTLNLIWQEFGQASHAARMNSLERLLIMQDKQPGNELLNASIEEAKASVLSKYETDYKQAVAVKSLIQKMNYSSKWTKEVEKQVGEVVKINDQGELTPYGEQAKKITQELNQLLEKRKSG